MARALEITPLLDICGHRFIGPFCRPERLPANGRDFVALDVGGDGSWRVVGMGFCSDLRAFVAAPEKYQHWVPHCRGKLMFAYHVPGDSGPGGREPWVDVLEDIETKLRSRR